MTNYFKNVVFLTRNTSITLTELDNWSYFEFEMYLHELKQVLDNEAEQRKKQQEKEQRQQSSMKAQLEAYMRSHKT